MIRLLRPPLCLLGLAAHADVRDRAHPDSAMATDIVAYDAGGQVCDGRQPDAGDGGWNPLVGGEVTFLETIGEWRLVGSCT